MFITYGSDIDEDYCNNGLSVDSKGIPRLMDSSKLGKYMFHNEINGKPSFKHINNEYYLYWAPNGVWNVRLNITQTLSPEKNLN